MAGFGEAARGMDRASKIMKFDGLPEKGRPIVEEFRKEEIPVLGSFLSTMDARSGIDLNPISIASEFGDSVQKPKFTAKITLFDTHGNDTF